MNYDQRVQAERWLAWVRLGAVPFAAFQTAANTGYPPGVELWTWLTVAVLGVGAIVLWDLSRRPLRPEQLAKLRFAALAFDFLVVSSFVLALYFQRSTPIRQVLILVLIEAAFRYGIRGGLWLTAASAPVCTDTLGLVPTAPRISRCLTAMARPASPSAPMAV